MVVLHGSHVKWDRHPDFLGRYDFAVTSPPSAVWLISRVETFKSSTVEYQKTVHTFGESGTRIYYTAFTWTDSNGNRQRLSRQELLEAFDIILDAYERVNAIYLTLQRCGTSDDGPRSTSLQATVKDLSSLACRMERATYYFASYLSWLADAEARGFVPDSWAMCNYTLDPFDHDKFYLLHPLGGTVDDYAFKTAVAVIAAGGPHFDNTTTNLLENARALLWGIANPTASPGQLTVEALDKDPAFKEASSERLTDMMAFRRRMDESEQSLLREAGPLVAPIIDASGD